MRGIGVGRLVSFPDANMRPSPVGTSVGAIRPFQRTAMVELAKANLPEDVNAEKASA